MIPLEDTFADVIAKAQRGLGISDSELAEEAKITSTQIGELRGGQLDETAIYRVAPMLGLEGRALFDLASGNWTPPSLDLPPGFAAFNTPYSDMTVNSYLVWDPATKRGFAFDTGGDCSEMLSRIKKERLQIEAVLLTHSHVDHIAALREVRRATTAPVYIGERESVPGAEPITEGKKFSVDALRIETLLTWGHSEGGVTYFVRGLNRPLTIVGDSIFAGSMGGGNVSYNDALQNNLKKILTLPDETIICPGHGPLTTVEKEKQDNPFFAGKISA